MKNLFIVFEGIDGSGTSTQSNLLRNYFLKKGTNAVLTAEPSSGPVGHLIREGLKKRVVFSENEAHFDQQLAYLFAADRHDHLYNDIDGVYKLLAEDKHVICTRYYFSSLAYHCSNEDDFTFVRGLNAKFPNPDLVIYIDNPVELSIERLGQRTVQDVYENKEKLTAVKKNYHDIFSDYEDKLLIVKGNKSVKEIHQEIINYIEKNF
ncbi:dTMP kinase [Litchfieldia salsa]|uniref:Thymidylate kinase n=1 Tax=Litchfieldia salsa TaxID=930152 RepID=A0A1H0X101_9BACI|nr:dTMP kinase [Litchfieldia salsa]SDP96126.1 dTMP kinase [Litchfieldia salsa]